MRYRYVTEVVWIDSDGRKVIYQQSYETERTAVERLRTWYQNLNILERQMVRDCSVSEIGSLEDEEIERLEELMERAMGGTEFVEIEKEKLIRRVVDYGDIVLAADGS